MASFSAGFGLGLYSSIALLKASEAHLSGTVCKKSSLINRSWQSISYQASMLHAHEAKDFHCRRDCFRVKKPNLVNAVRYSELHPNFEVLPHADRVSLRPGDVAKICVQFTGDSKYSGERFWVLIATNEDGVYTGKVDNDLAHTAHHGLQCGDLVTFDYRHIYDFERGPFSKKSNA